MKTQQQIGLLLLAFSSITECASACSSHHGNNNNHHNETSGHHTRGGYAQNERRGLSDPFWNEIVDAQFHDAGAGGWCGTQSLPLHQQIQVMATVRAWGDRKQRRRLTSGPYTVDVRFVDIKASEADADVPQVDIDASMAILNDHFNTTDFNFRWMETVRAVNSDLATCEFASDDKHASIGQAYRDGNVSTLNVFLCDIPEEGRAGVAYFPYDVPLSLDTDGIYLDPRYLGENQITLSHEAGHWLGLQHPFENGCEFPGDGISDTPYQTILGDSDVADCCVDTPDTCPEQPGNDPIDNLMGYVNNCIVGFTPEQSEFMCNVFEKYRLYSTQTEFCFIDLIVEFNDNPADITIFVENNGIYYIEKDGADYTANERVVFEEFLYDGPGSVTIQDASANGFAGGRVMIEVLEGGSLTSARTTILDFEGGSFTDIGTEEFVVPDNCIAVAQAPATQSPIGATPSPSIRATDESTPSPTLPDTFPPTTQASVEQPTTIGPTSPGPVDSNQPIPLETVEPSSRQTTVENTESPTTSSTATPITYQPTTLATVTNTESPTTSSSMSPPAEAPVTMTQVPDAPSATAAPTLMHPQATMQPSTQLPKTVQPVLWPWPWPDQPTNGPILTTETPSSSWPPKHHNVFSSRSKGKGSNYYEVYSRKSKGKGKTQSYKGYSKSSKMKKSSKKHGSRYSTQHGTPPYYQPPSPYNYPSSSKKQKA